MTSKLFTEAAQCKAVFPKTSEMSELDTNVKINCNLKTKTESQELTLIVSAVNLDSGFDEVPHLF